MKQKTTKTIMTCIGATLAVCSAVTMMGSAKAGDTSTKKSIQKTVDKVAGVVDAIATIM